MKLIDSFKIDQNLLKSSPNGQMLSADVFSISADNLWADIKDMDQHTEIKDKKVYNAANLNKVNTIIDPKEIEPSTNEDCSFNPTLLAQNWLTMGYGTIVLKSRSKSYLFKLLEFNKLEIQES